jgi:antitoxin component of MazEF toxin-antitoxin module
MPTFFRTLVNQTQTEEMEVSEGRVHEITMLGGQNRPSTYTATNSLKSTQQADGNAPAVQFPPLLTVLTVAVVNDEVTVTLQDGSTIIIKGGEHITVQGPQKYTLTYSAKNTPDSARFEIQENEVC